MNKIIKEWQDCGLIKVFEFRVIDKRDGSEDWIIFCVDIIDGLFVAQHEPLNQEQRDSEFIAAVKRVIDPDFSLDENLQELYADCEVALAESEFFAIAEEQ